MIESGHDYQTIINTYTLDHVRYFLEASHRAERQRFRQAIYANRAAQLTKEGFEKYLRQLNASEPKPALKLVKGGRAPMTYEEQIKLEQQHHVQFNQLSQAEQDAITAERESLWAQIPAHIQAKSRKLAGR